MRNNENRIRELQAKLRAREGRDGFQRNAQLIREELRRLGENA